MAGTARPDIDPGRIPDPGRANRRVAASGPRCAYALGRSAARRFPTLVGDRTGRRRVRCTPLNLGPWPRPDGRRASVEVRDVDMAFRTGAVTQQVLRQGFLLHRAGETLGLVGESGSGKSTTGPLLVGLYRADRRLGPLVGRPITGPERRGNLAAVRSRAAVRLPGSAFGRSIRACASALRSASRSTSPAAIRGASQRPCARVARDGRPAADSAERFRTSSRAASASASSIARALALQPTSSSATSRCRRSTCRSRPRSSTC